MGGQMEEWEKWLRSEPCHICGLRPVEIHHVMTRKRWGQHAHFMDNCFPVCRTHHREWHDTGVSTFIANHMLSNEMIKRGFEYNEISRSWYHPKLTKNF